MIIAITNIAKRIYLKFAFKLNDIPDTGVMADKRPPFPQSWLFGFIEKLFRLSEALFIICIAYMLLPVICIG